MARRKPVMTVDIDTIEDAPVDAPPIYTDADFTETPDADAAPVATPDAPDGDAAPETFTGSAVEIVSASDRAMLPYDAPHNYPAPTREVIDAYVDAGFLTTEVEGYERDLIDVSRGMHMAAVGWVDAGSRLAAMKDRTTHGSWGFLMDRIGLSAATAQRMMAAYNATVVYPQVNDHIASFTSSALTLIGQRKDVTPDAIDAIIQYADAGEATVEIVLDEIKKAAPVKEKKNKKHKTFFANMDPDKAHDYRDRALMGMNEWTGLVANAGANLPGLQKSPDFKKYVASVLAGDADLTALQRSVAGFLAFCYIIDHPHDGHGNAPQS